MTDANSANELTFWEHLDVLRDCLSRIIAVTVVCAIVVFFFKDEVFSILLAPKDSEFITFRWLNAISERIVPNGVRMPDFQVKLFNTGLAQQFLIHTQVSVYVGIVCASPYILYVLFRFISPALYARERKYALGVVGSGYIMFFIGVALNYLLIFPLTIRFLGTYQVTTDVENIITLQSYIETLVMMTLMMGIVFEIPVLCWLLAKMGLLNAPMMARYRRHAIITILVVAAIITPTSDAFTLTLVALPIWLLYEGSICLVRLTTHKNNTLYIRCI